MVMVRKLLVASAAAGVMAFSALAPAWTALADSAPPAISFTCFFTGGGIGPSGFTATYFVTGPNGTTTFTVHGALCVSRSGTFTVGELTQLLHAAGIPPGTIISELLGKG